MPTTLIAALQDAEQRIDLMFRRHGRYSSQYLRSVAEYQKLVHEAFTVTGRAS